MKTLGLDLASLSLCNALDLAVVIEEEARDRYEELASQLQAHHTPEAAAFFERMSRIEEIHHQQLLNQRTALFGDTPSTVTRAMIFDIEAPEYDAARAFMTQREALQTALASEVKAHDFFASVLEHVRDPEVRTLFEELRDEEVEHQRLVKVELGKLPPEDPQRTASYSDDPVAL